jgi:hypothetical protein
MAALTDPQKSFVVTALARYDAPASVRDALRDEFGVEASLAQLAAYNPDNAQAARLASKWRTLFEETRRAFVDEVAGEAVAHKAVRVRRLGRWADRAERMGNLPLAASLYEQIAREMGEAYTNRRLIEHSGNLGLDVTEKSDAELAAIVAGRKA